MDKYSITLALDDLIIGFSICIGGAFGGNRGARPVPPEKGVFPLDHMHLCDLVEPL